MVDLLDCHLDSGGPSQVPMRERQTVGVFLVWVSKDFFFLFFLGGFLFL
jgi:hypothetical protein